MAVNVILGCDGPISMHPSMEGLAAFFHGRWSDILENHLANGRQDQ
jgi:hypothetical protein